jgi:hypothetical protein
MFVSSYNTYIQTNASDRVTKQKEQPAKSESSFSSKFLQEPKLDPVIVSTLPVDYVNRAKSFNTKLEMKRQEDALKNPDDDTTSKSKKLTKEFMSRKTLQSAKSAYEDNSKMFSIYKQPHHTLDQTPTTDKTLPENIQKLKEQNMRRTMVNTYIQNDKYYQITA